MALSALQQAVKMAKTDETEKYFDGFKAWDDYIQKLKALEHTDEKTRKDSMQGERMDI
jgi:hypothetical protein